MNSLPISITTDYAQDKGCPEPALRRIAAAGFTHVHWCHQWNTDFLYCDAEIEQIRQWLAEYNLILCDLHASDGQEKRWCSAAEYERRAGIELVRNRIQMTARLGADIIIMHIDREPEAAADKDVFWTRMGHTLDELEPYARMCGVRIALENGHFPTIRRVLSAYPPDYLGLCYDCGHGNLIPGGLDELDALKDRLVAVHLHDNDGLEDLHRPVYAGTVDWPRLTAILARSAYAKCPSMELSMRNTDYKDEEVFLADAFQIGQRLAGELEEARQTQ